MKKNQTYDFQCARCHDQLDFTEAKDLEGSPLIVVEPCPICSGGVGDPMFDALSALELLADAMEFKDDEELPTVQGWILKLKEWQGGVSYKKK